MINMSFINFSIVCRFGLFFLITAAHFSACHFFPEDRNLLDLSSPHGRITVDVLNPSETYYLLGLRVLNGSNSTTFLVDHSVTFGKEVNVLFGDKAVSILPFARNAKILVTNTDWKHRQVRKKVAVEYDLHGTHIVRKYLQTITSMASNVSDYFSINFEVDRKSEGLTKAADTQEVPAIEAQEHEYSDISYVDDEDSDSDEDRDKNKDENIQEVSETTPQSASYTFITSMYDAVSTAGDWAKSKVAESHTGPKVDFSTDLSQTNGFQSRETLAISSSDFKCTVMDNVDDLYKMAFFQNCKLPLPEKASRFEVCYVQEPNKANILVTSLFDKVSVEQYYTCAFTNKVKPLLDFTKFKDLKPYNVRNEVQSSHKSHRNPFHLNIDAFEGDDNIEKISHGKCDVFRYLDGKEHDDENDRYVSVTRITFGSTIFEIPEGRTFVMASRCFPYTSTTYVSIMLKNGPIYENKMWHSIDSCSYHERKEPVDSDRLDIMEYSHQVWNNRDTSGRMGYLSPNPLDNSGVLCIGQFKNTDKGINENICKPISKFSQYKLISTSDSFTVIKLLKNSDKSPLLIGNCYMEIAKKNEDTMIYISHTTNQPTNVLIQHSPSEHYSVVETNSGSNNFILARDVFNNASKTGVKLNTNLNNPQSYNGITWNINMLNKSWTFYPKSFPYRLIGDVTFKNAKILSHNEEGYKYLVTPKKDPLTSFELVVRHEESKTAAIRVSEEGSYGTKVDFSFGSEL
ncbi:hypothetical protein BEWA_033340 [Theileria equi strain WA]|uniref:Uncharacterized protein n=1 Tax=Theileria equi strain WA TaxID=1537102 RepID=L0AZQ9_THEEQ|nr:hypothetical protein BEWA_033340 [Theileria equi strain WA]AFZ80481.1 hypothetical protein BEWA_033340 [Theileria equi strain WA]|eukprot:XP_004830147.1 hypothetical protein BEWA_033340 [Theileria equi strain WA]